MKHLVFLAIAVPLTVVLIGTTEWPWWACACAGILAVWICLMIFMVVVHMISHRKKNLIESIERHEKLEERLTEDVLSLMELYNIYKPNSRVTTHMDEIGILRRAMDDVLEHQKHKSDAHNISFDDEYKRHGG